MENDKLQHVVRVAEGEVETARRAFRDARRDARGRVAVALAAQGEGRFLTVSWSKLRAAGVSVPTSLNSGRRRYWGHPQD